MRTGVHLALECQLGYDCIHRSEPHPQTVHDSADCIAGSRPYGCHSKGGRNGGSNWRCGGYQADAGVGGSAGGGAGDGVPIRDGWRVAGATTSRETACWTLSVKHLEEGVDGVD